ncbi:hypothetical protein [Prochlorococcus marinus]|uniref:hypothetical protein n=1 Tax=Prochlorococcus marinus TaxID=1219 RepID=UPI0007B3463D|nr:hypothetical protein [Prochlorococcus marinus]KZR78103.1 hypothetical protein PMIT1320_00185 [Prochlorococcus marinus str. MIT 1320]
MTLDKKKVLFIFDSGRRVGYGHQARCERLAHNLQAKGIKAACLGDIEFESRYITEKTNINWQKEGEWKAILKTILRQGYHALIIDIRNLMHTKDKILEIIKYCSENSKEALRVVIDELNCKSIYGQQSAHAFAASPHILILPYFNNIAYKYKVNENCTILSGSQYALIDSEFEEMKEKKIASYPSERNSNLLIAFGRSDAGKEVANRIIKTLEQIDLRIEKIYATLGEEKTYEVKNSKYDINFVGFNNNMPSLLKDIDIAIAGSGTIRYETCCSGIPTLCFSQFKEHTKDLKEFAGAGLCKYGGEVFRMSNMELANTITQFANNEDKLRGLSLMCLRSKYTSGNGVKLIGRIIAKRLMRR